MAINTTFNATKISTSLNNEEIINHLRAELDLMLQTLEKIKTLNSLGKTKQIHDEIDSILINYNR